MYNMWRLLWHIRHKNCNLTLSNGTYYKIQPLAIERLSCDIFIIIVWYFARTCFKGSNIDSHQVLTFFKILSPVISTITTSLLDSKCHLSELENFKYNKWNKYLNLVTIGKLNKTCPIRFVLWSIQCCRRHVGKMFILQWWCDSNVVSLKKKVPFAPKLMNLSCNSSLINPICYIRDCVMKRVTLSTLSPSKLAHTYNLPSPNLPIIPMFHGINKNIQLHK
jgi:hypothetical protein